MCGYRKCGWCPVVFKQDNEPTLARNESAAMWEETDTGKRFYIYRDSAGNQQLVEVD